MEAVSECDGYGATGAVVGAGVALASSVLTNLVSWRNERTRQQAVKNAANEETARHQTALAFTELFALNHAVSWITWFASMPRTTLINR